jgi:predicted RNA-binding protein
MCESRVYLARGEGEELFFEDVAVIRPVEQGWLLTDIFGQTQTVQPAPRPRRRVRRGSGLDGAHLAGVEPLGALGDLYLDLLAFGQGSEALSVYRWIMNKDVAALGKNEAIPFGLVEPLDLSLHLPTSLREPESGNPESETGSMQRTTHSFRLSGFLTPKRPAPAEG